MTFRRVSLPVQKPQEVVQVPKVVADGPGHWKLVVKTIDVTKPAIELKGHHYIFNHEIHVGHRMTSDELISRLSN